MIFRLSTLIEKEILYTHTTTKQRYSHADHLAINSDKVLKKHAEYTMFLLVDFNALILQKPGAGLEY